MEQIAQIERPGMLTRIFFKLGERMFAKSDPAAPRLTGDVTRRNERR